MRRLIFCLFFCLAIPVSESNAAFIETSEGVFQHDSRKVKVVISFKEGAEGLFIMAGEPVDLQQFNLEKTGATGYQHLFVRFDLTTGTYSEVIIGEQHYKITGNLTIRLSELAEVGIDNSNPYISIVASNSIIGFIGLNKIVDGSQNEAAILAANQLDSEFSRVIKPYTVGATALELDGKTLQGKTIGIKTDQARLLNPCLKSDTLLLSESDLEFVKSGKNEQERALRFEEIQKRQKVQPRLLFLRVTKEISYALSPGDQAIKIVQPFKLSSSKRQVCMIESLVR